MKSLSPLQIFRELNAKAEYPKNPTIAAAPAAAAAALPRPAPGLPPISERHRWGLWPAVEIPLADVPPRFATDDERILLEYMQRQEADVVSWIVSRATAYASARKCWNPRQCELAASLDCALWQREPHADAHDRPGQIRELLDLLRSLENAAQYFARPRTTN